MPFPRYASAWFSGILSAVRCINSCRSAATDCEVPVSNFAAPVNQGPEACTSGYRRRRNSRSRLRFLRSSGTLRTGSPHPPFLRHFSNLRKERPPIVVDGIHRAHVLPPFRVPFHHSAVELYPLYLSLFE